MGIQAREVLVLKLNPITVSIDELLLDANNPRFVIDLNVTSDVPEEQFESMQDELLKKFDSAENSGEGENFFSIDDLKQSMKEIGYVGIDRIVVKRIQTGKFIVLEGNRRTATIKTLRKNHIKAIPGHSDRLSDSILQTFENLEVMELVTDGLTPTEVNEKINVILGLRHYGSLLEWDPLPKAFNMYHNYMSIEPQLHKFKIEQSRIKEVASRLSIRQPEVRQALKTYIAYLQLSKNFSGVDDKYYSLIQAAITNKNLVGGYIVIDDDTYELDEKSLEKLNRICQFENRDKLVRERKQDQIIVREPKKFKLLGDLVKKSRTGASEAIRTYAEGLLNQVEAGEVDPETGKLVLDLDAAVNAVNDFEANSQWVDTLSKLLQKQEEDGLRIEDYKGIGNDLMQKEDVERKLQKIRRILDV